MKSTRSSQCLYTTSLFILILLTAVCVAISAADVSIQALANKTTTGIFDFRNLVVVGGTYVVLAFASLLFTCSRVLSVRRSLHIIPKAHIPIRKTDLPKKTYLSLKNEFDTVKRIRENTVPRSEDIQAVGWAKPGTPLFEGLDFKQAIARTPAIVESAAMNIDVGYQRPAYCPVRQYIEFLIGEGLVDKQLGSTYVQGYEIARFSRDPLSQQQYIVIMKYLATLLKNMGYTIKPNTARPEGLHENTGTVSSRKTTNSMLSHYW
ncbi:hypothetical protein BY458DRAFT_517447 [Sporodiniella umbellata]|nr:hypothetical protein BY458DRAFT_517447 [Sporodiniella umbellata]